MLSRLLRGSSEAPKPNPNVAHIDTPEDHITKAIKFSAENNFTQCLSHLISFATTWTLATTQDHLSQQEKLRLGSRLEELNQIIRRKLDSLLLSSDDHILVNSVCRILSCLQSLQSNSAADNEGLEIYLDFLEKIVHKDATEYMKLLVEESDTTTSATVLADLFSLASQLIHDAAPLALHFKSDADKQVATRVHKQCMDHVTTVFDLFSEELNLTETVQQLQTQSQSQSLTSEYASSLITNPLQLDETLQTISLMCAYSSRYITFIQKKAPLADCGHLETVIQVTLGHYLALESYYLESAMAEAIKIHQEMIAEATDYYTASLSSPASSIPSTTSPKPPPRGTATTSITNTTTNTGVKGEASDPVHFTRNTKNTLVDDGFFIIKKCLRRGLSTLSPNVACAIANSASMALETPYFASFGNVIEKLISVHATDTYLELLNDLELSLAYIGKLQRDMEGDIVRLYSAPSEKTKLVACLDDLIKASTQLCNKLRNKNIMLYSEKLNARIESTFIALFRPISYELDENTYEQAEINDPFMLKFLDYLAGLLSPTQQLRDNNRADVALNLAKFIGSKFENAVLSKKFTSLGAVQLSKEISQLGDYFVSVGGQPLRYQFTKLAQISQLLNLDRAIDCMEYWIEGKAVFKLDANEVRQVLTRRIDFTIESINALKLS